MFVKNDYLENSTTSTEKESDKDFLNDQIKTTNVNILLNRVRLDKKRTLKKRIFFSVFLAAAISCMVIYFIV
tara:strand:+ start:599 stop:814 length:216 start_codon:yes stop_codon:yes gene_type:complete